MCALAYLTTVLSNMREYNLITDESEFETGFHRNGVRLKGEIGSSIATTAILQERRILSRYLRIKLYRYRERYGREP